MPSSGNKGGGVDTGGEVDAGLAGSSFISSLISCLNVLLGSENITSGFGCFF